MKLALPLAVSVTVLIGPASAQQPRITCSGMLIEVDMKASADFPMAVVYDNQVDPPRTCVLDVGRAGHWPLRGACTVGEKCLISGPYYRRINNTYYMRQWDRAETPPQ